MLPCIIVNQQCQSTVPWNCDAPSPTSSSNQPILADSNMQIESNSVICNSLETKYACFAVDQQWHQSTAIWINQYWDAPSPFLLTIN